MKKSSKAGGRRREMNKEVRVVYISSPMKVKTTAGEFRNLVQQLTGKDSDTARFMESQEEFNLMTMMEEAPTTDRKDVGVDDSSRCKNINQGTYTSSDCSASLEAFDDCDQGLFLPMEDGGFMSMVQSSFLDDLCQFDALN